jgi:hypothetical protein
MDSKFYKQNIFTYFQYVFLLFLILGNLLTINAQTCTPDATGNYFCADFIQNATLNVDGRLNLKHDATVNKKLFTTRDNKNGVYVRNTNCWIGSTDFTAHCVYSSSGQDMSTWGGQNGDGSPATMITPRHCLSVAHAAPTVGSKVRFVSKDNVVAERTVQAVTTNTNYSTYFPDICVVLLNEDVPTSISVAKFLPANYRNYILNDGNGLPILHADWERKALVANVGNLAQASDNLFYAEKPSSTSPNRVSFYEGTWGGDSGSPYYLILNGQPVLIGLVTGIWDATTNAPYGTSQAIFANKANGLSLPYTSINDLIKKVDTSAGVNTGYQISFFNFSAATALENTQTTAASVSVVGRLVKVETNTTLPTEMSIYDSVGRKIMQHKTIHPYEAIELPAIGIYIVQLISQNTKQQFKIISH